MAMTVGSTRQKADINVTLMIDVLLVLIIIFMVITPLTPRGLEASIPQGTRAERSQPAAAQNVVITVRGDGTVSLNQQTVDLASLQDRLVRLFKSGGNSVVFLRGESGLEFRRVAGVLDIVHGAGVSRVGLMSR